MSKVAILIGDSQRLFAECLAGMLSQRADFWVLEELPATGREAIEAVEVWSPEIVLLDYWITGMEGPAVVRGILNKVPGTKVLLLSWFHGAHHIRSAIHAGAVGYLPKSLGLQELVAAIERARAGESPVLPAELSTLVESLKRGEQEAEKTSGRFELLTTRELEILILLSRGGPIDEVASLLSISPLTLKTHIRNILAKTGARSHSEAVAMALRSGWIQI